MIPEENTVDLEINITNPSSSFLPFQIYQFKKQINVPVTTKIEDTDTSIVGGGGDESVPSNGIFGYFQSFFRGFSQTIIQNNKHNSQNKNQFNKLFYSGSSIPEKEEPREVLEKDLEQGIETETEKNTNIEITKITLSAEKIDLRESLKGTKLYFLEKRKELPSHFV